MGYAGIISWCNYHVWRSITGSIFRGFKENAGMFFYVADWIYPCRCWNDGTFRGSWDIGSSGNDPAYGKSFYDQARTLYGSRCGIYEFTCTELK